MEGDLHLIGSYYIAKEKEAMESKSNEAKRKSRQENNINLNEYAHQNVDRFAVLMDAWTNEVNFLEMKKNVGTLIFFL